MNTGTVRKLARSAKNHNCADAGTGLAYLSDAILALLEIVEEQNNALEEMSDKLEKVKSAQKSSR